MTSLHNPRVSQILYHSTQLLIDKGAKVDLVEENVGEYFVYPSGKVTTVQSQPDGSFAEVTVYTRGG